MLEGIRECTNEKITKWAEIKPWEDRPNMAAEKWLKKKRIANILREREIENTGAHDSDQVKIAYTIK